MDYISHTSMDQKEMLEAIEVKDIQELFSLIPKDILEKNPLNLNKGLSEIELKKQFKQGGQKNISLEDMISFQGAGAYDHYIPSIIEHIVSRSEFYTSYTPYQAELSQGTLQSIYEYQSMICELTAMDIANSSLLDGGSAAGEAVAMASRITGKSNIIMSRGIHPRYREIAETYGKPVNLDFKYLGLNENYQTNLKKLDKIIDNNTAAVVVQYPNFYGSIEKMSEISNKLSQNENNPLFIVIANPITLGVLKPPGEFEADIVVGEGQPLGNGVNYGGPYLGYMAVKDNRKFLRQMPGRLAGGTTDKNGNKGYVLTLQTREQHIRREDATSNICTNEALNALIATIYMAVMGKNGLKEVGNQCLQKAHYLADKIENIPDFEVVNKNNFFHEFLIKTPENIKKIIKEFTKKSIIPGVNISRFKEKEGLLVCVTEKRTKKEMDKFISVLEGF